MYEFECIHCLEHIGRLAEVGQDIDRLLRRHLEQCPRARRPLLGSGAGHPVDHFRLARVR